MNQGQFDKAVTTMEEIVTLRPEAQNYKWYAYTLNYSGKPQEAIKFYKKSINMNPKDSMLLFFLGASYFDSGQYKEAIEVLKKSLYINPGNIYARSRLAATYYLAGEKDNARKEVYEILRIDPNFSAENYIKIVDYKNQADTDRILNALKEAGLK